MNGISPESLILASRQSGTGTISRPPPHRATGNDQRFAASGNACPNHRAFFLRATGRALDEDVGVGRQTVEADHTGPRRTFRPETAGPGPVTGGGQTNER